MVGVGYCGLYTAFVINAYYTIIIAWAVLYFFRSFSSPLPWSPEGAEIDCPSESPAGEYFYKTVLGYLVLEDGKCRELQPGEGGLINWDTFGAVVFCYLIVYLCIFRGVKSSSFVVWFAVPLPIILILILLVRGATLPGAGDGIDVYLHGEPGTDRLASLSNGQIWTDAAGQIFFSLGLCEGVLTAQGSYNAYRKPVIFDTVLIAVINCSFSFLAGFAVFSVVGYLRHIGSPVSAEMDSFGLAFISYPTAVTQMGGANWWNLCLFLTFFTLGIDSTFATVEAVSTVVADTRVGRFLGRPSTALALVLLLIGSSVSFCANVGIVILNVVDHYVSVFMLLLKGVLQPFAVGWMYEQEEIAKRTGIASMLIYNAGFWVILEVALAISLFALDGRLWIGVVIVVLLFPPTAFISFKLSNMTWHEWVRLVPLSGVRKIARHMTLLGELSRGERRRRRDQIFEVAWCVLIKYVMPISISILLLLSLDEDIHERYRNYPDGSLWIGRGLSIIFVLLFAAGLLLGTQPEEFSVQLDIPYDEMCVEHIRRIEEVSKAADSAKMDSLDRRLSESFIDVSEEHRNGHLGTDSPEQLQVQGNGFAIN